LRPSSTGFTTVSDARLMLELVTQKPSSPAFVLETWRTRHSFGPNLRSSCLR